MNIIGIAMGFIALGLVGFGFFWVVRLERALGWTWWPWVIIAGLVLVGLSLFIPWPFLSALVGAFGASLVWGATELRNQAIRVELGWYPANPEGKRKPPLESIIRKLKAPDL